jgi:hypothetical protein
MTSYDLEDLIRDDYPEPLSAFQRMATAIFAAAVSIFVAGAGLILLNP